MSGAGLIVSTFHEGKIKYVLLQGKFQDEGYLDLPKGQVDKNEKIKDAAFREAFEEADIRKSQVSIITNEVYTPLNSSSLYLYLVYIPFERIADLKVKVNPKTSTHALVLGAWPSNLARPGWLVLASTGWSWLP